MVNPELQMKKVISILCRNLESPFLMTFSIWSGSALKFIPVSLKCARIVGTTMLTPVLRLLLGIEVDEPYFLLSIQD